MGKVNILDTIPKDYKAVEALCDFSEVMEKAINKACKDRGFNFGGGQHVLEYWDKKADGSVCYGIFFPDGAGETELRFWVGLHWDKKNKKGSCSIVFNVYIPVNLLFLRPKIAKLLKEGAKDSDYYDIPSGVECALVLKEQHISDNELEAKLTGFIADAWGIVEKLQ
jgi:hypothetical protein